MNCRKCGKEGVLFEREECGQDYGLCKECLDKQINREKQWLFEMKEEDKSQEK